MKVIGKKGFTLIEMLVVVLIIGILAGVALPQYQMAVTKAKVASILPLMRRWKDAMAEYKLQHGHYGNGTDGWPDPDTLGVSWPSDWTCSGGRMECWSDYWYCFVNEESDGFLFCKHDIDLRSDIEWGIDMFPADYSRDESLRNKIVCYGTGSAEAKKVCKALGGKLLEDHGSYASYLLY